MSDPTGDTKAVELIAELNNRQISMSDFLAPGEKYITYMRNMPLAAKVGNWLFCHAGLLPNQDWQSFKADAQSLLSQGNYSDPLFIEGNSILEAKGWWNSIDAQDSYLNRLSNEQIFGVVQGHQPSAYNISNEVGAIQNGRLVKIDSGMAPDAGANPGELLHIFNPTDLEKMQVPTMELIQANGTHQPISPRAFTPTDDSIAKVD